MTSLKKYYVNKVEHSDGDDDGRNVALGVSIPEHDSDLDEESLQALAYLNTVKSEASKLPFAVEAVIPNIRAPTIGPEDGDNLDDPQNSDRLVDSIIEYFTSVRSLVRKNNFETEYREIEFEQGMSEPYISGADYTSVTTAIEHLDDQSGTLGHDIVIEYLWALLVYLDFPLLEDTAAALQSLRKYCDTRQDDSRCRVCSIVIARFFHQP
jgi:hypothetical protein